MNLPFIIILGNAHCPHKYKSRIVEMTQFAFPAFRSYESSGNAPQNKLACFSFTSNTCRFCQHLAFGLLVSEEGLAGGGAVRAVPVPFLLSLSFYVIIFSKNVFF